MLMESEEKEDAQSVQPQNQQRVRRRPKKKFKLFSLKDTSDQTPQDEDVKEQNGPSPPAEDKLSRNLVAALGKISAEEHGAMRKLYDEFLEWLHDEGQHCVDNKKINEKQRELEMKVGDHVTSLITDSYNISRSCRSLSMSLMQF